MHILFTGFMGNDNSAKVIVEKIQANCIIEKIYLENDFKACEMQLLDKIKTTKYDLIFAFGQKPVIKAIYIETIGSNASGGYSTSFDYCDLADFLKNKGFKVTISKNAGNYLCNHIYNCGLDYIENNQLTTEMIFIHTPYLKNIDDVDYLSKVFSEFLEQWSSNN